MFHQWRTVISSASWVRYRLMAALTEKPMLPSVESLHRARQAAYTRGKGAIY